MAVVVCEKAIAENTRPQDCPEVGAIHGGRIVDGGPTTQKAISPARPDDPESEIIAAVQNTAEYFPLCLTEDNFADRESVMAYRPPWDGELTKAADGLFSKESWARYRGPMGGQGYVNTVTGEVRYTGSARDDVGEGYHGADPDVEDTAAAKLTYADGNEVAAATADALDIDIDSLRAATKETYGESMDAESVARQAVTVATDRGDQAVRDVIGAIAEMDVDAVSDDEFYDDDDDDTPEGENQWDTDYWTTDEWKTATAASPSLDARLTQKDWQPYEGPRGGQGWYNPQTNEVRYQDGRPDDDDIEGADGELGDIGFRDVDAGHILSVGVGEFDWDTGSREWTDETIRVTTATPNKITGMTADGTELSFNPTNLEVGNYRINGLYQQTPETDPTDLIPDEKILEPTEFDDLAIGDFVVLEHYGRHYGGQIIAEDEAFDGSPAYTVQYPSGETGDLYIHSMGDGQADPRLLGVAADLALPERYADKYDPIEVDGMPAGDGADHVVPFGHGAVILGSAWEWGVDEVWSTSDGHPRFSAGRGGDPDVMNTDTFGYAYPGKEGVPEPGWYKNPDKPKIRDDEPRDFLGIVGETGPVDTSYDPDPELVEANSLDLEAAAASMQQVIESERDAFEFTEAKKHAGELVADGATYDALVDVIAHGLESIGKSVDREKPLNKAADIALNGVKRYLHEQAQPHPTYDGDLSLGSVDPEFRDDFVSTLAEPTEQRMESIMKGWVDGQGSMVDEHTIPLYLSAADEYPNEFLPTRNDPDEVLDAYHDKTGGVVSQTVTSSSPNMDADQHAIQEYREKTVEAFREAFGDTITVFRGYNPDDHSKGKQAREALQADDPPDTIAIRNGVLNSWSTDPMVAHQFSIWTNEDTPGVVLKRELPVEDIWGASDTAPGLWAKEAEIIAGNPEEVGEFDRENVFLPEEFDPATEARQMVEGTDETAEKAAADGETLRLDWELSSVGWLHRLLAARDSDGDLAKAAPVPHSWWRTFETRRPVRTIEGDI